MASVSQERIAEIAKGAYELGDLGKLHELSQAAHWAERHHVHSLADLTVMEKAGRNVPATVAVTLRKSGVLPEKAHGSQKLTRTKPAKSFAETDAPAWMRESDTAEPQRSTAQQQPPQHLTSRTER